MSNSVHPEHCSRPSDHMLLRQLREGQGDAASELHSRYAERILRLARASLSHDLSARLDAEDIVQSVFSSFFRGVSRGFYEVPEGQELWGLFLVITLNKIRARGNYHRAARRDVRRTHASAELDSGRGPSHESHEIALLDLQNVIESVLQHLPNEYGEAILMRVEGYRVDEIARKLRRSRRTVERMLQEFRQRLARVLDEEDCPGPAATG